MTDLHERVAAAGNAALRDLMAKHASDLDYVVSGKECDKAFAAAVIPMILEEAAKVAEARAPAIQCMSVEPVVAACDDIAAAIRALGQPK